MKNRRSFIKKTTLSLLRFSAISNTSTAQQQLDIQKEISSAKDDDQLFRLIRKGMLLSPGLAYLNTGSLGPSPAWLVQRMNSITTKLEANPVGNNWGPLGQQMEAVRQKVADFIHANVDEVILTRNTTEGLNLIGANLKLKPGDEILTTTHEHGGGENGLQFLAKQSGAKLRKMQLPMPISSKDELMGLIQKEINPKTKVLLLSHINTITGLKMPFEEISSITRPKGIFLIADGAQAIGMVNVNVKELGVDAYSTSGHKWLMGPKETGFLYIRKEAQERIQDVFTQSNYAAYSASSGTRNVATIIGLGEIIDWHQMIGKDKIEQRCRSLAQYCRKKLEETNDHKIISPSAEELNAGIVSINLNQGTNRAIFEKMRSQDIVVKLLPKYNALRFSTHIFNSKEEIDRMVEML